MFRNSINRVTTQHDEDIESDHNLLVANVKVKLKRIEKKHQKGKVSISDVKKWEPLEV